MIWVLLLTIASPWGLTSMTQEFNTEQACQQAATSLVETEPRGEIKWVCTPKGVVDKM